MINFSAFMTKRLDASTAFVSGDPKPLDAIAVHHDPATIFPPPGMIVEGFEAVNTGNETGAAVFALGSVNQFDVLHSGSGADLAYWTGIQRSVVHMADGSDPVPMDLRVTELFRMEDGGWKLFHRHADPLRQPPLPKD